VAVVIGSMELRKTVEAIVEGCTNAMLLDFLWTREEFKAAEAADKPGLLWVMFCLLTNGNGRRQDFLDKFCYQDLLGRGLLCDVLPESLAVACGLDGDLDEAKAKAAQQRAAPPPLPPIAFPTRLPVGAVPHGDFIGFGLSSINEATWRESCLAIVNNPSAESEMREFLKGLWVCKDPLEYLRKVGERFTSPWLL